ncbi:MAG: sugar transferase [Actinomycetota bacterium]|nr:sugar transferase [Actinomycetota bacterium]
MSPGTGGSPSLDRLTGGLARRRVGSLRRLDAQWLLDGPGWPLLALGIDLVALAFAIASALAGASIAGVEVELRGWLYAYPAFVLIPMLLRGMYQPRMRIALVDWLPSVIGATSIGAMSIVALVAVAYPAASPGPLIARAWLFATLYLIGGRALLTLYQRRARAVGLIGKPTLIVGAGRVGAQVARRLASRPEYGLDPVGFLDADPSPEVALDEELPPVLGTPDDLGAIVERTNARHLILAFSSSPDRGLIPLVRTCSESGVEVSLVPRLFESINARVALEHLGGLPLLGLRAVDPKGWQFTVKYALDRLAAAVALVLASPVMLAAAVAVRVSSPGPVLYRQRRCGRDGKEFDLLKFRSMRLPPEGEEEVDEGVPAGGRAPGGVEGRDRRTAVGRFLRRTSIDELPQLLNVLRGQMSIVGPRPERPRYAEVFVRDVDRYGDRHRVKAGITGWAQVHGLRGRTSLADRVEWDNYYIENWSLWLDFKILILTVTAVFAVPDDA